GYWIAGKLARLAVKLGLQDVAHPVCLVVKLAIEFDMVTGDVSLTRRERQVDAILRGINPNLSADKGAQQKGVGARQQVTQIEQHVIASIGARVGHQADSAKDTFCVK